MIRNTSIKSSTKQIILQLFALFVLLIFYVEPIFPNDYYASPIGDIIVTINTSPLTSADAGLFVNSNGDVYYNDNITAKANVAGYTLYSEKIILNDNNVTGIGLGGIISLYGNLKFDSQHGKFEINNTSNVANGIAAGFAYYGTSAFNGSVTNYGDFSVYSKFSNAYGFIFSTGYPAITNLGANSKFEINAIDVTSLISGVGFQAGDQANGGVIDINKISVEVNGGDGDSYGWGVLLQKVKGKVNVDEISVSTGVSLYQNSTEHKNSAYGFASTSIDSNAEITLGKINVTVGTNNAGHIRGNAVGVDVGAAETTYLDSTRGQIAGKISVGSIIVTNYSKVDPTYGFHVGNDNIDNNASSIKITGEVLLNDITVKNSANGVGDVAGVMVATSTKSSDLKGVIDAYSLELNGKILADAGGGTATSYGIYAGQIKQLDVTNSIIATGGNNTKSYGIYTTGSTVSPKGTLSSIINIKSNVSIFGKTNSLSLNGSSDVVNILSSQWNNGGRAFTLQDVENLNIGFVNNPVTATMISGSSTDDKTLTKIAKGSKLLGAFQSEGKLDMDVNSSLGIQLSGGENGKAGTYFKSLGTINSGARFFVTDINSFFASPVTVFGGGVNGTIAAQVEKSINQLNSLNGIYEYKFLVGDNNSGKILKRQTETARLSDIYLNALFMHSPFMREAVEKHISDYRHPRQLLFFGGAAWANYVGRGGVVGSNYIRYDDTEITSNGIQVGYDFSFGRLTQFGVLFGYEDHSLTYNISGVGRAALLNAADQTNLKLNLYDVDNAKASDFYFGIFGVHQFDFGSDIRFYVGAGFQSYQMNRYDLDDLRKSRFDGSTFEASIEYGYRLFSDGNLSFRPTLSIDYNYNTLNDAAESRGGYTFSDAYLSQLFLRFGADVNWKGIYGSLYGGIYYSRQLLGVGDNLECDVQGSRLIGIDSGDSILTINIGARYNLSKTLSIFGGYNAEIYVENNKAPTKNTGNIGIVWYWR
ncbi:MAG: autotransporter outer membrane beta-barrel domain-containing protein [Planctomycetaceae bacterium]|nr:autotransporter outer membrane beta-barrel domain-containing protein [Planctomycetaceae bacterium]